MKIEIRNKKNYEKLKLSKKEIKLRQNKNKLIIKN